jgi:hypothetical protein
MSDINVNFVVDQFKTLVALGNKKIIKTICGKKTFFFKK